MEWILPLIAGLGGLGVGSLLTSVVNHFMTRRAMANDRWYQEKRQAYLGLLDALHQVAVHPSEDHSKDYDYWQTRCHLFGSKDVSQFALRIIDGPIIERREDEAYRNLIEAMRVDLRAAAKGRFWNGA